MNICLFLKILKRNHYIIVTTILPPLLHVLNNDQNVNLRVSALSIIGCACETSPLALTTWFRDVVDWVLNILDIQKEVEVKRGSFFNFNISPFSFYQTA